MGSLIRPAYYKKSSTIECWDGIFLQGQIVDFCTTNVIKYLDRLGYKDWELDKGIPELGVQSVLQTLGKVESYLTKLQECIYKNDEDLLRTSFRKPEKRLSDYLQKNTYLYKYKLDVLNFIDKFLSLFHNGRIPDVLGPQLNEIILSALESTREVSKNIEEIRRKCDEFINDKEKFILIVEDFLTTETLPIFTNKVNSKIYVIDSSEVHCLEVGISNLKKIET